MPIFLSLFFFISSTLACTFKPEVKKIVSLSGPITVVLNELNLLNHEKVKGISVFHPVSKKDLKPKIYPGGVFLSQSTLNEFDRGIVFYDESRELRNILLKREAINSHELKTRNLSPLEVIDHSLNQLAPFVLACEPRFQEIKVKARKIQDELLGKIKGKPFIIFYLGEFRKGRPPELVIVNDGVPKLLIDGHRIQSYPSTLSYVNWSSRLMSEIPREALHVGIKDSGMDGRKEVVKSERQMTLYYPGALVPGLSQLEAFNYWASSL